MNRSNLNLLIPEASSNSYGSERRREEILEAVQHLETIRQDLGNDTFGLFAKNVDLYRAIVDSVETLRNNKPKVGNDIIRLLSNKRSTRTRSECFMVPDRRRLLPDSSLQSRLDSFKNNSLSSLKKVIQEHIDSNYYESCDYRFDDNVQPRFRVTREKRRWCQNRFQVNYDVVVSKNWIKSGAKELASIFGYKFFPLVCEPVITRGEARAYRVRRAIYKSLVGANCEVKEDEGYAAYILRPGHPKGNLTGWADTLEGALHSVEKARAKEARERLLKI